MHSGEASTSVSRNTCTAPSLCQWREGRRRREEGRRGGGSGNNNRLAPSLSQSVKGWSVYMYANIEKIAV